MSEFGPAMPDMIESQAAPSGYNVVTQKAFELFASQNPEIEAPVEQLKVVLGEIDDQIINNWGTYESSSYPGVSFAHTKIAITPELVAKLGGEMKSSKRSGSAEEPEKVDYFLFSAIAVPPGGHPMTVQDVGIDRVIRLIPQVAHAIRDGLTPPEVNVHFLGAPSGMGGTVTPEWIDVVSREGMDAHGKLYAEFIDKVEEPRREDLKSRAHDKKLRIVLQGVSKGAVVADKTSSHLAPVLQEVTQRLFDNPAGHHERNFPGNIVKGVQVASGLVGEIVRTMPVGKDLGAAEGPFFERLNREKHIPQDSKEQQALKMKSFLTDGKTLFLGEGMDTSRRAYVRQGLNDPLTRNKKEIQDMWRKADLVVEQEKQRVVEEIEELMSKPGLNEKEVDRLGEQMKKIEENALVPQPIVQEGHVLKTRFEGKHFFFYNRFKRWAKILNYASGKNQEVQVEEPTLSLSEKAFPTAVELFRSTCREIAPIANIAATLNHRGFVAETFMTDPNRYEIAEKNLQEDMGIQSLGYTNNQIKNGVRLYYRYIELARQNPFEGKIPENGMAVDKKTFGDVAILLETLGNAPDQELKDELLKYPLSNPIDIFVKKLEESKPPSIDESGGTIIDDAYRVEQAMNNRAARTYEAELHYARIARDALRPFILTSPN